MSNFRYSKSRYAVIFIESLSVIFALILISGCSTYPNSPTGVFIRFGKAISESNWTEAEKYCTGEFASKELAFMKKGQELAGGFMPMDRFKENFKQTDKELQDRFESSIDGDTAKVWLKEAGFAKFKFKKIGGKWKLDSIGDFDFGEIQLPPGTMENLKNAVDKIRN